MANMTLAINDKVHRRMQHFSEIRWSEVARKAIEKKIHDLELLEKLTSKSTLTEEDVDELSTIINSNVAKKLLK